jgi:hypothetical protein
MFFDEHRWAPAAVRGGDCRVGHCSRMAESDVFPPGRRRCIGSRARRRRAYDCPNTRHAVISLRSARIWLLVKPSPDIASQGGDRIRNWLARGEPLTRLGPDAVAVRWASWFGISLRRHPVGSAGGGEGSTLGGSSSQLTLEQPQLRQREGIRRRRQCLSALTSVCSRWLLSSVGFSSGRGCRERRLRPRYGLMRTMFVMGHEA